MDINMYQRISQSNFSRSDSFTVCRSSSLSHCCQRGWLETRWLASWPVVVFSSTCWVWVRRQLRQMDRRNCYLYRSRRRRGRLSIYWERLQYTDCGVQVDLEQDWLAGWHAWQVMGNWTVVIRKWFLWEFRDRLAGLWTALLFTGYGRNA